MGAAVVYQIQKAVALLPDDERVEEYFHDEKDEAEHDEDSTDGNTQNREANDDEHVLDGD